MITVTTRGMLYHKDTHTLLGVWPNSTNTLNAPPFLSVRGKQRELVFKLDSPDIRGVCFIYEYRNAPDYYILKMYYSRVAMLDWWYEAQRRT